MLEQGTIVAGYRIEGLLGHGGMGVVYEATQLSLDRTVALKVLATHLGEDPGFRERFRREGLIQAGVDHPHIIAVYEAGEIEEGLFLAMRLVRGPNLKDMVTGRELDGGRTLRILTPIADALDTAHEAGLIHRDIKPQNILVARRDHAYLADFGLTKGRGEVSLTKTGQFVGTFDYISPEQIRGDRASNASDIYSLAAVLYECLTGVVPYPKQSEAAVLYAQMADPPPCISDQRPELPPALDDVIARAMAKTPEDRHSSAGHLLQDATRAFSKKTRAAMSTPGPFEALEEAGIRPPESEVDTRQSGVQETDELATGADLPEPTRGAQTRAPAPADTQAPVGDETRAAPPADTRAPVGDETGAAHPADTRAPVDNETGAAHPDLTRAAVPGTARAREPGPTPSAASAAPTTPADAPPARPAGDAAVSLSGGQAEAAGTPAPVRPYRRRRRAQSPVLIGAAAAFVLALGAAGFLWGNSSSTKSQAPGTASSASSADLQLSLPVGWRRLNPAKTQIPGVAFAHPDEVIELVPPGSHGGRLIAGLVAAGGPSLLPKALLDRLGNRQPSRDDTVRLGKLAAYRYRGVTPTGSETPLTLYVVPNTGGVATVACITDKHTAAGFPAACERVASTLELPSRLRAYPLGPSPQYADTVKRTFARLNSNIRPLLINLGKAKTPKDQATLAARVANAYGLAAAALAKDGNVPPAAQDLNAGIVRALQLATSAYSSLSAAARGSNAGSYRRARRLVLQRESEVRRAVRHLTDLGYTVP